MITRSIARAYAILKERKWDTVYWAIDVHGTIVTGEHEKGHYEFINSEARTALRYISRLPETKIILWSSMHDDEQPMLKEFLASHDIKVHYFNENPEIQSTARGAFDQKFYFSVLLDDKAGFHPDMWKDVRLCVERLAIDRVRYDRY